jgi:hypothetical protein
VSRKLFAHAVMVKMAIECNVGTKVGDEPYAPRNDGHSDSAYRNIGNHFADCLLPLVLVSLFWRCSQTAVIVASK